MASIAQAKAFQKSGKFKLTSHAKERIRQRVDINVLSAQVSWVNEQIARASEITEQGNKVVFKTESYEIVCDGITVVTIKPFTSPQTYVKSLGGVLANEVRKMLTPQERLLRKAEIKVAELTLNYLKARNPKTKAMINARLVQATDDKQRLTDKIYAIKKAAEEYGVEV